MGGQTAGVLLIARRLLVSGISAVSSGWIFFACYEGKYNTYLTISYHNSIIIIMIGGGAFLFVFFSLPCPGLG